MEERLIRQDGGVSHKDTWEAIIRVEREREREQKGDSQILVEDANVGVVRGRIFFGGSSNDEGGGRNKVTKFTTKYARW